MMAFEYWDGEELRIGDVVKAYRNAKSVPSIRLIQSKHDGDGDYIAPPLSNNNAENVMYFDPNDYDRVLVCRCDLVQTILELFNEDTKE